MPEIELMPHTTKLFVSPHFTYEKLEPPFYRDLVDVFEDRMLNWLLVPAKKLLEIPHGAVPAVALATNYIEGIEIYISGTDSKGRSKEFFRHGFKRIFTTGTGSDQLLSAVADALYESLRCGFAHDGMFRSRIYFSSIRKEALTVTWPRKGREFDPEGKLQSAVINPARFVESIELHFKQYMRELRAVKPSQTQENFRAAIALKWKPGEAEPLIAMTEEEFHSTV